MTVMRRLFLGVLGAGAFSMVLLGVSSAWAVTAGPGWSITSVAEPTNFSQGDNAQCTPGNARLSSAACDRYVVRAVNTGSGAANAGGGIVIVADSLPLGFKVLSISGRDLKSEAGSQSSGGLPCTTMPLQCRDASPVPAGDTLLIVIQVAVETSTAGNVTNTATVSGGGAPSASTSAVPDPVNSTPSVFGVPDFHFAVNDIGGEADTQAGDHPSSVTTTVDFATALDQHYPDNSGDHGALFPARDVKDVVVDLPLGLVGDPQAAARCPQSALVIGTGTTSCPAASKVGEVEVEQKGEFIDSIFPIAGLSSVYNLIPEAGYPAEFGFNFLGQAIVMYPRVTHTSAGYVLQVMVPGVPRFAEAGSVSLTFFGDPAEHDGGAVSSTAFLTNPVDCQSGPLTATVHADSWENPGEWVTGGSVSHGSFGPGSAPVLSSAGWVERQTTVYPSLSGCDLLQFNPSASVRPDVSQADEPSGYTIDVQVPQANNQFPVLATPPVKDARVTFPAGVAISPAAADGLQACTDAQIALESSEPASCPAASQVGTVQVTTPLLSSPLEGQLFVGTPECEPCSAGDATSGRLLRLFIQVQGSGVVLKLRGTASLNPATGQVTTTFRENPQFPFSDLQVHLTGGPRAALANPQACGTFTSTAELSAWSAPVTPDASVASQFNMDWDGNGGACPGVLGFAPGFLAQTQEAHAGAFTPFTLTLSRHDREQDLSQVAVHTPPGLLGLLSQVTLCGEPQAAAGTCPQASRIGTATAGVGSGSHPFYVQGPVYLTGPYRGAPFGLSVAVPAAAGPFNLGMVVVRAAINVDPGTAALTVTADPLPQILDGIPLRVQTVNVTVDRPGFIFNPTNCEQQQVTATVTGAQGATAQVSSPFAVSGCAGLGFAPRFSASSLARTSKARGASLDVRTSFPQGAQANIRSVVVTLPRQLPARLTTIQQACPDRVFNANPAACPLGSLIGVAMAISPVLPVTLSGPAFLVSHGGAAFPDVVMILQGEGVRVDLVGHVNIKGGVTTTTLPGVPDVPVSSFELNLPEGPHSALAANGDLCAKALKMATTLTGQNGAVLRQSTRIAVIGCAKAKKKKQGGKGASAARKASHGHGRGRSRL